MEDRKVKSFFPLDNEVLFNKEESANSKILLAAMYRHKSNEGIIRASNKELSVYSGIAAGNIGKYLTELVKNKHIAKFTEARKKGSYQMLYTININQESKNFKNYTKVHYEMITEYKNDLIIKYAQLTNLLKINSYNLEERLYTTNSIIQSNWLTIADVMGVFYELDEAGLFYYKRDAKVIYDEEFNRVDSVTEDIRKDAELVQSPAENKVDSVVEEPINNIQEKRENITPEPEVIAPTTSTSPTNSNDLIKYFYGKRGGKCANWGREAKVIKDLLDSYTVSELMTGIDLIVKKGHTNLLRLSYNLNEALQINKIKTEFDKQGTAAWLIKKHHEALKIKPNPSTIIANAAKVQAVIDEHGFSGAEKVINHMIDNGTKEINFINGAVDTVLAGYDAEYEQESASEIAKADMQCILMDLKDNYQIYEKLGWSDRPEYKEAVTKFNEKLAEYKAIYGGK